MATDSPLVLVTGASGFIATHVVLQLQEAGYRVRGTVRDPNNEIKVKHLTELCPHAAHKLELVSADLTKPETWPPAVKGVTYVLHVASPNPDNDPSDENEVIKPAVEGTQHLLAACVASKTVKRVVLTSSTTAVRSHAAPQLDRSFTESDWSNLDLLNAYGKSKHLQEKAAWDFVNNLKADDKLELAVINPGFVLGPPLQGQANASSEVPKRLLEGNPPLVAKLQVFFTDVRDVAAAHIKAMTVPEAAGHRHIAVSHTMWMQEIAMLYKKEFRDQGYKVPTTICPNFLLRLTGLFDKTVKMVLPWLDKSLKFDNTRMRDVLGITPRDATDTLLDTAYTMIERGFVHKTPNYRGRTTSSTKTKS